MEYYGANASCYIRHYGVKGMHWGERRYQSKDGKWTKEGLRRRRTHGHAKTAASAALLLSGVAGSVLVTNLVNPALGIGVAAAASLARTRVDKGSALSPREVVEIGSAAVAAGLVRYGAGLAAAYLR